MGVVEPSPGPALLSTETQARFLVQRKLGTGGMGVVYDAFDLQRGERVALKVMRGANPERLLRFKQEFRSIADIRHPNLIALYELLSLGGEWCLTMELIDGVDFRVWVGSAEPGEVEQSQSFLSVGDLLTVDTIEVGAVRAHAAASDQQRLRDAAIQLARGIDALHTEHRLHCDIKPSNVLVGRDGRVVLCDFGLVRFLGEDSHSERFAGTIPYMSPEQAVRGELGPASDWYSFGVLLHVALAGRPPFIGGPKEMLEAKLHQDPKPVRHWSPSAPSDLAALCDQLLLRRPAERPRGADVLEALGASSERRPRLRTEEIPFVGRERELAELADAFAGAEEGRAPTVWVSGASGVGKTALLENFVGDCAMRGALVLRGRCHEREAMPFKAIDGVVDALATRLTADDFASLGVTDGDALLTVFPVLRRLRAGTPLAAGDPTELRRRACIALRTLLVHLAMRHPVVIWIDDGQWTDLDSGQILAEVVRPPGAGHILLVVSHRSGGAESPALGKLVDAIHAVSAPVLSLDVPPLPERAAAELAAAFLGDGAAGAAAVAREARGIPFFVVELARHVAAGGEAEAGILDRVLATRLAALSHDECSLLVAVAVASRPIELGIAAEAANVRRWREALLGLERGRLVRALGIHETDLVETCHDRVRETAIALLHPGTLETWHARLANAYECSTGHHVEALVEHWRGAGDRARAAAYAVAAGDQAAAVLAFDSAAEYYRQAVELGVAGADRARDVQRKLADALAHAGRGAAAADAYVVAATDAPPATWLALRHLAAEQLLLNGHLDRGISMLADVLAAVGLRLARSPRRALVPMLLRRAWLWLRGLAPAPKPKRLDDKARLRIEALWTVARSLGLIDHVRGAHFGTQFVTASLDTGEPWMVARALCIEVAYSSAPGNKVNAGKLRALLDRARDCARAVGDPYIDALAATFAGLASFARGDWAHAEGSFEVAVEALRTGCTGVAWEIASADSFRMGSLFHQGRLAELAEQVPEAVRAAEARGDLYTATQLRVWTTNVAWLIRDDVAGAEREIATARRQWTWSGYHLHHFYALMAEVHLHLYCGRGDEALAAMDAAWTPLRRSLLRVAVELVDIEALRLWSQSAMASRQLGRRALARVRRYGRRLVRVRHPYARGFGALVLAAAAHRGGDRAGTVAQLTAAERNFAAAGMHAFQASAAWRRAVLERNDLAAAEALALLSRMGAADPARFASMLAPGLAP